ncbi:MAG: hypothetical protein ACQET4_02625 [Pseudomonadota bacterium]
MTLFIHPCYQLAGKNEVSDVQGIDPPAGPKMTSPPPFHRCPAFVGDDPYRVSHGNSSSLAHPAALQRLPRELAGASGQPAWTMGWYFWPVSVFSALVALGSRDLQQRSRTLRRNYPILAHLRYCMEGIGPEIRQYFVQSDTEERPFSREQRSAVYQRATNVLDKKPFGSVLDMYA